MFPTSHKDLAKHIHGPNRDVGNVALLGRIFVAVSHYVMGHDFCLILQPSTFNLPLYPLITRTR